jgi:ParB-like chromosome segregation protein Spo0J
MSQKKITPVSLPKRKMEIVYLPIKALNAAEYNPRKISRHDLDELKKSLQVDVLQPAVVNINPERKNVIIGGHQRIRAAKELGWTEYPCVCVNYSLEREREMNVRLNKNAGEWDFDVLQKNFTLPELETFGFEPFEVEGLFHIAEGGNLDVDSLFDKKNVEEVAERKAEEAREAQKVAVAGEDGEIVDIPTDLKKAKACKLCLTCRKYLPLDK